MEQLPISNHIVVASHSGGKLPVTNANALPTGGAESNFADLLAAQISAPNLNAEAPGAAEGMPLALPAEAPAIEISPAKADEQATQQLAEFLSALPLPQLPGAYPADKAVVAGEKGKSDDRLSLAASMLPDLISTTNVQTALVAEIKPAALLSAAAKTGEESAIIAATDKALPKHVLGFEVAEAKQIPLMPTQMPTSARAESAPVNVPTPTTPVPLAVDIKVGTPGWDTAFSQRVAWAATNQHQVAELRLNPPNLGPVEIRITVSNDQATAMFVSAHASVRDSIEAALPKLREMLGESGLTLGNVNVSSQSFQQQQQAGEGQEKSNAKHGGVVPELALGAVLPERSLSAMTAGRNGLVDIFA
ncbi:MAG: flagellar hook-length control protein FliK [Burkholderiales bacterium]|nr:flagellar hook-length control protein FliK [Burkholderiales bacterium]